MRALRYLIGIVGIVCLAAALAIVAYSGYAAGGTTALTNAVIVLAGLAGPAVTLKLYRKPERRFAAVLVAFVSAASLITGTRTLVEAMSAQTTTVVAQAATAESQPTAAAAPPPPAAPASADEIELQRTATERAALYYIPTSEAEVAAARAAYLLAGDTYRATCSERRDPKCEELAADLSGKQNVLLAVVRNRSTTQEADELDAKAARIRAKINAPHPAVSLLAKFAQAPTASVSPTSTVRVLRWQLILGTLLGELMIASSLLAWAWPARPSKAVAIRHAIGEVPTRALRRTPADDSDLARFLDECIHPSLGESVEMRALYVRFLDWCDGQGLSAAPPRKFSQAVVRSCVQAQIEVGTEGADVICRNVKLAPAHLLH